VVVHNALRGIALMVSAMVFLPVKDGMVKLLGKGGYPPLEIVWAQFCIVYLMLAPIIAWRYGIGMLLPRPLGGQLVRGIFAMVGIGFFYWAVQYVPLATTTAIYFLFYIFNRKLAIGDPAVVMLAHSVLVGAILLSFAVPFVWVPPKQSDAPLIGGFVLCAMLGQGLLMASFKNAAAFSSPPSSTPPSCRQPGSDSSFSASFPICSRGLGSPWSWAAASSSPSRAGGSGM